MGDNANLKEIDIAIFLWQPTIGLIGDISSFFPKGPDIVTFSTNDDGICRDVGITAYDFPLFTF